MRKLREILPLRQQAGLSVRQISASLHLSPTTVGEYLHRCEDAGLPLPDNLTDAQLEQRLFPSVTITALRLGP